MKINVHLLNHLGLSLSDKVIYSMLFIDSGLTNKQIADVLELNKITVSRIIGKLEKYNLIKVERSKNKRKITVL